MAVMKRNIPFLWWLIVAFLAAMGAACGDGGNKFTVNQAPTASFTYSCTDLSCSFDGTGSSDPDGEIVTYSWTFGDGGTGSGATITHAYDSVGTRAVTLSVTDDDGATGSQSQSVSVTAPSGGDITLLPVYNYEVTTELFEDPIVVGVPMGDDLLLQLGCPYGCPNLVGEYELETGDYTIEVGSHLSVGEVNQPYQLFGVIEVSVTETFTVPFASLPTSGGLSIDALPYGSGAGRVELLIRPEGAGVALSWDLDRNGSIDDGVVLSWEEFDELLGSEAPEWQQLGAFGYAVLVDLMPALTDFGIGGIQLIMATREELPAASPVTAFCDAFSDLGLSVPPPPPVIPDEGFLTFAWHDDAASGDVSPGDSFSLGSNYCLLYFPGDDAEMLDGLIEMNSWTEVVSNGVLTRVGFEGTSPAGKSGGLVFKDFELWEVWDTDGEGPGTLAAAHLGARVNGRMTVVFFAPAN
jgi:PKD repeat protein